MTISRYLSTVTMPKVEKPYPSILFFLKTRFPLIGHSVWEQRIIDGKVFDDSGTALTLHTEYNPQKRIFYYREVDNEPVIPFTEEILFQNNHLLVSCKPHFLPVIPGGPYVSECLLNRLRTRTGIEDLVPIHRIDRETAGIVMFSVNRHTRNRYSDLFTYGRVEKTYHAVSENLGICESNEWSVANRIVKGEPWFRMKTVPGEPNAHSLIKLVERKGNLVQFVLHPLTGKTHQLRLHMSGLGFRIMNDRYYPDLQPETADDFNKPLQLIAQSVQFDDPITGKHVEFASERKLIW